MRRISGQPALLISGLALLLASCSSDAAPTTTAATTAPADTSTSTVTTAAPETTTSTSSTTSTSTTTTEPASPTLAVQGDENEIVEAVQYLLNCNGFGELTVDGVFGPATLGAVEAAQGDLGLTVDGAVDEDLMDGLSRSCSEDRRIEGEDVVTVVGNAAEDDPEVFAIALLSGSTMAVTVTRGAAGLDVTVARADGSEVPSEGQSTWLIDTTDDYRIEVASSSGTVTFTLAVVVTVEEPDAGDWILATDGVIYKGTKLAHGDDAQTVIDKVFEFLGHGIRGAYDEFDTDWYTITEPSPTGLRGVFTEGFAFLFFGPPDPENPDRPETFVRHRFEGPGLDADGNPRPDDYATTAEGITVGDTLFDLKAAYGSGVRSGSNSEEHYYRFSDSGGELCFYFGPDEPTDFSPIIEIASECRSG
jgi:peptidoglycan hydrolase-like protein with peptidoglycan-binding domain